MTMYKGDHLVSDRTGYDHHGIYMGDGKVIHYSGFGSSLDKGAIEVTSLEDFTNGNGCKVVEHFVESSYDADVRIDRALSRLGEEGYNLLWNNCESFVNWVFYDINVSNQVVKAGATAVYAYRTYTAYQLAQSGLIGGTSTFAAVSTTAVSAGFAAASTSFASKAVLVGAVANPVTAPATLAVATVVVVVVAKDVIEDAFDTVCDFFCGWF
ncbi:lecithin retinol acyltransferase family protein [Photobacterium sp. ZSDE20]|uniref:Lecithin retinol acyltransferase family protein n=1 Tax=Photobacterium pectinilyticum TaxID=2906793 RepID=A0ABT1N7N7_9GAMM|nr:lecithin retinol acyltransferase family protein [Photobacterium sp. ZSDE20]MCQ1060769.1 lecithin retinol acyltransferase family protein [Photobacterium sp. ZSDE20]MDD1828458.1 lecithin retinol acyltransferase family protein [Photobacterium sp. ZSDE20]